MSRVEDNEIGGSHAMPLRALDDVEIVKGDPDIRGWEAVGADGARVGRVVELLVDTATLRVSQVLVERDGVRHQVPIEAVQLQQGDKRAVIANVAAMKEVPSHGNPRTDAVAAATGLKNEDLIERAESRTDNPSDVEVERVPIVDGALRASDVAADMVRLPAIDEEALLDEERVDPEESAPPGNV